MGDATNSKAYNLLSLEINAIIEAIEVHFDENDFKLSYLSFGMTDSIHSFIGIKEIESRDESDHSDSHSSIEQTELPEHVPTREH